MYKSIGNQVLTCGAGHKTFHSTFQTTLFQIWTSFNVLEDTLKRKFKISKSIPIWRQFRTQNHTFNITTQILLLLMQLKFHFLSPSRFTCLTRQHKKSSPTYHSPDCLLFKKHTAQNKDYVIQMAIFRAQIWGNFHENSRRAKSNFKIIHSAMFLIRNMRDFLNLEKITLQRDLFFLLADFMGISLPKQYQTSDRHWSMKNVCPVPYFMKKNMGHSWQWCFFQLYIY